MSPPTMQQEEEDEGTITSSGIVLRDPKKTSSAALTMFVTYILNSYQQREEEGYNLWINFLEDFSDWDEASFNKVDKPLLRSLRELLFNRGVYTPKDGTHVYKHLARLAVQPWSDWPAETPKPKNKKSYVDVNPASNSNTPGTPASNTPGTPASAIIGTPTGTGTPLNTTQQQYHSPLASFQTAPTNNVKIHNAIANYQEQGLSRELTALTKLYTEEMKYNGRNDAFDYKLKMFLTTASNAGIPSTKLHVAFQYMLSGDALNFYFNNQSHFSSMNLDSLRLAFKGNFEGREHQIARLNEWNSISLQLFTNRNKDKTLTECLDAIISRLRELQHSLDENLQGDSFIHQKIITACESEPACESVCRKPPETIQSLIQDLRSSTALQDRRSLLSPNETMYTDRRYRNRESSSRSQSRYPSKLRYDSNNSHRSLDRNSTDKKRCFVCKKEGCWSTNHPKEERQRSIKQYLTDVEGEKEGNSESSATEEDNITNDPPNQDKGEAFLTSMGAINGKAAYQKLANQATLHAVTKALPIQDNININIQGEAIYRPARRYGDNHFYGLIIDTGAAHNSSAGYNQYLALRREQNVNINTDNAGSARFKFGIGDALSKGTVAVQSPIGIVEFHIVDADTPFLLCLRDLDQAGFYFNNLTNRLVSSNKQVPVTRLYGHPFLVWGTSLSNAYCINTYTNNSDVASSQLSEQDLRRLHRRFGHPSTTRLARLLKRSGHRFDQEAIHRLGKFCSTCQKHGRSPGRFKFTIKNDLQFNHSVIIDIIYLDSPAAPVLHAVDEATRFQTARFLKDISAETVWDTLRACWIDTYVGPPDMLVHDAGKQFISTEFASKAKGMAIEVKCVPVEAHHSIGLVERYHAPLRRAYDVIREDLPLLGRQFVLQIAVKAINDTAGPDGLTPTLLLFGTFPKLTELDPVHPSITERGKAIKRAMKEASELLARRDVTEALRHRNGPQTDAILDTPISSNVLVWREGKGWKGPYQLLATEDEACTVKLSSGPTTFRITSVKPYLVEPINQTPPTAEINQTPPTETDPPTEEATATRQNPQRQRHLPSRYAHLTDKEQSDIELSMKLRLEGAIRSTNGPFIDSRRKEIDGLIAEGVFQIISKQDIPPNTRIFGCRFVDNIKWNGATPFEKSRLVVQAHNDKGKKEVLTQSPTIQRASQRLIVCLAAILLRNLCVRDISQAYVQSTSVLSRAVYVKPPQGTDLGDNMLKVVRPLYGVPEAGTHWFKTYHTHHTEKLGLTVSSFDPCLMFSKQAIVGLQTDDSLFCGTTEFVELEEQARLNAGFPAKPIEKLDNKKDLQFNGTAISTNGNILELSQQRQCNKINTINAANTATASDIKSQYIKERARGAYIASMCQPEMAFALSRAAQITQPAKEDADWLNKWLNWQKENHRRGLQFIKLAPEKLKLLVFVDAAFANNADLSSQIGYVIVLANEQQLDESTINISGNIIHWSSTKCKRVTRSVLASELYAMVAGFDIATALQSTVEGITQAKIPLILCTDSYSLYDCIIRLGTTAEKRLMIDIMGLRQSYERREIDEVRWIDGNCNPADAMTKERCCQALKQLVDSNTIKLKTNAWVEREAIA